MSAESLSHSRSKLNDRLNIPTFWELIKTIPTVRSEWHLKTPVRHLPEVKPFVRSCLVVTLNSFVVFKMVLPVRDWACIAHTNRLSLVQRRSIGFCCGTLSVFVLWCDHRVGHLHRFLLFAHWRANELFTLYMHSGNYDCGMCVCAKPRFKFIFTNTKIIHFQTLTLMALSVSKKRFLTHDLIDFGGYYIYPHKEHEDIEYVRICSQQIDESVRGFFMKIGILFLAMCICVFWPVYSVTMYGTKTTTLDVKIPFVEAHSDREFLFNSILMLIIASHAGTFYVGLEVAVSIWVDIATAAPKLIAYEFKKLDDLLHQSDGTDLKLRIAFLNIAKQVLDTNE